MSYTGNIKVSNDFRMPLTVTIIHRSGLMGEDTFASEQQIASGTVFQFENDFVSYQTDPFLDFFQITGRFNRGNGTYVTAEATIKYSWNKTDNGGAVEIVLGETGVTFIPPSNQNGISQTYDRPIG